MRQPNGFTLIELLVSMVIGAMLLASLSWVVATLVRQTGSDRGAEMSRSLATTAPVLMNLFSNALQDELHSVVVSNRNVSWYAPLPHGVGDGIGLMTLDVRKSGNETELVLSRKNPESDHDVLSSSSIIKGAKDIYFSYASDNEGDEQVVRAVTMTVRPSEGPPQKFVFPIYRVADGRCVFDPVSMSCRPQ
jgi:prepilin-type N-terminal cleavage/methylation domain-containing protein